MRPAPELDTAAAWAAAGACRDAAATHRRTAARIAEAPHLARWTGAGQRRVTATTEALADDARRLARHLDELADALEAAAARAATCTERVAAPTIGPGPGVGVGRAASPVPRAPVVGGAHGWR